MEEEVREVKEKSKEEETVSFKTSERMMYGVLDYEGNELMAAVTGYGLDVSFNMRLIHSLADAESCANALADIFYQALMEKLLAKQKPEADKQAILTKRQLNGYRKRQQSTGGNGNPRPQAPTDGNAEGGYGGNGDGNI
ncbi:hypothetical protein [Viscerimonas tarda]